MAFAATGVAGDLTLGNYLKIVSKGAVYNNLSEDSPIWDLISKKKKGPAEGRELRFLLRSAYGSSAASFVSVSGGAYPTAAQATLNEGSADYKDFALTVEVERTLISKAIADFSRYGEPLAEELRCKSIALSRQLSRAVYGDGTGILGQVSSIDLSAANQATVTLTQTNSAYGFIGWFELGDRVKFADLDGVAATTTNAANHWTVVSKDRADGTVTLSFRNSSDVEAAHGGAGGANAIAATDVIYRLGTTAQDVNPTSGITDYGSASEEWAGLESLSEDDGRTVNGIALTGALAGTRRNAAGNPIDSQDFQQMMSQVMIAVGQGRYKYNKAMMSWETLDALIESREVDRRFQSIQDNKRGVAALGYVHGKNTLMFEADEFCRKDRIYTLPEGDVLQFHGSDFEFVKPEGGQKFFLTPNSSADGHKRSIRAYMEGSGVLVSVHSPAIGVIENFTV